MNNSINSVSSQQGYPQVLNQQGNMQLSYEQLLQMGFRPAQVNANQLQNSQWNNGVVLPANAIQPPQTQMAAPTSENPVQQGNLLFRGNEPFYVHGALIIPVEVNEMAGKLFEAKAANLLNQEWQQAVTVAAEANGGLGNEQEGYLAWSKAGHFVRLYNPSLSPEHNQRLAQMSLQGGWAVEDLPSRWEDVKPEDQATHQKLEEFLTNFDTAFQKFSENPAEGLQVKDGRHHFLMQYDAESGYTFSNHYKMPGGIRGWLIKNFKKFGKVADVISVVANFIPGWGTAISACVQAIKKVGGMVAAGKAKASDILSTIGSFASSYFGGGAAGGVVDKVVK